MDSIHGNALLKMGLIVAPSCNDCHGVHNIKRAVDRDSPINHANIAKTCGKCHRRHRGRPTTRAFTASCSRRATRAGRSAPTATPRTKSSIPTGNNFKAISDERCGKCHADRLEGYRDTYHGKAMALGKPNAAPAVAACYDCHGYPRHPAAFQSRLASVHEPTSWPPARNVIRARRQNSPNTSRTPIRWTRRIIPCCTWCSWR